MRLAELLAVNARGMLEVLQARVADLGDDEMAWAPTDDVLRMGEPAPRVTHYDGEPSPVATIGWRLEHIATGLTEARVPLWLSVDAAVPPVPAHDTADAMRAWLADASAWFCSFVASIDDAHLEEPLGSVAGQWGDSARAGFVSHLTNEAIHHGAEVGVLRDLWRAGLR